ncbi:hypothetical protein WP12_22065 [Sphingomonas sp. SRS2]|nr:hypothetical protein WP12_22065 [Sphingomonas sp. SRS2]
MVASFARHALRALLGRAPGSQPVEYGVAQIAIAFEPAAGPAEGFGLLLLSVAGPVADLRPTIALQLPLNRRWLAIQSCSDLPDRLPVLMNTGNLTSLFKRKLLISSHGNT